MLSAAILINAENQLIEISITAVRSQWSMAEAYAIAILMELVRNFSPCFIADSIIIIYVEP